MILVVGVSVHVVRGGEIDDDCKRSGKGDCGYCARIATNRSLTQDSMRCSLCTNGYILDDTLITVRNLGDTTAVMFKDACTQPPEVPSKPTSSNLAALLVFSILILLVTVSTTFLVIYFCCKKGNLSKDLMKKPKEEAVKKPAYGDYIVPPNQTNKVNNSVNDSLVGASANVKDATIEPSPQPNNKESKEKKKIVSEQQGTVEKKDKIIKKETPVQTIKKKRVVPKQIPNQGLTANNTSNNGL